MNYKPDEATLIAYLYGEMNGKEKDAVEKYFMQHPQELKKLNALSEVRNVMSYVQEKEVIAPPIIANHDTAKPMWRSSYLKFSLGVAASILFLLIVGKIFKPEINYSKGELRISFGNKIQHENILSEEKVKALIASSLASNTESQKTIREENDKRLMQLWIDMNAKKIDALAKNASAANKEQVQSFLASLQEQNVKLIKDYFQVNSSEQKKYMENLLVDFSQYLQEQRKQDLQLVQAKINHLEKTNSQIKQETEQLFTSLISNPTRAKNNY